MTVDAAVLASETGVRVNQCLGKLKASQRVAHLMTYKAAL